MATYTVTGHPLNIADLGMSSGSADTLRAVLSTAGVGTSVTLTLPAPDVTTAELQGVIK
jgi:hypothetical protein